METEQQMANTAPEALVRPPVRWKVAMVSDEKTSVTIVFPDQPGESPAPEKQDPGTDAA